MRFVCESCRAQYMINDEKVGPKGVKVRCRKCGYVILVKRADASKGGGPVAMSNDPDDALATQVMQTPLSPAEATLSSDETQAEEMTNPGTGTSGPTLAEASSSSGGAKDSFFGADEDEIGAVFDQVLKGGSSAPKEESAGGPELGANDDRQSTRVIDADTVRKLAEESGVVERPMVEAAVAAAKNDEVPTTDWYVAINEKQTGPLTLEKIKEHWDKGEIGPDSLCWRAGFDDWIPVSDAKLASVLAPKPPKPIVVAPAATITQSTPALVTVPVQSAFSSGGMMQTVQGEMQVPMSAAGANVEETGSWKPSGASALASLVKDEMDALSKPPPKPAPVSMDEAPLRGGLLDLPQEEKPATNAAVALPSTIEERAPRPPPPAPVNPYLANPGATYSAPAVTQYRPPSNRNLMIGIAAGGGAMLLILIGLIVWLATRPPAVVVQPQQPIAVAQPPVQPTQPVAQPTQPVAQPTQPVAQPTQPVAQPTQPVAVQPTQPVAQPTQPVAQPTQPVANPTVAQPPTPVAVAQPAQPKTPRTPTRTTPREDPPEPKETKRPATKEGDDFDAAFGGGGKTAPKEETTAKTEKKPAGYIPPAPGGGGEVKPALEQSDIMEGVLAKKADLAACAGKKEAGTSGKIVMKWTIQTSGKPSNVGVDAGSEDLKGTPMAGCFANVIKSMTFPKHKQQGDPVKFPFKY